MTSATVRQVALQSPRRSSRSRCRCRRRRGGGRRRRPALRSSRAGRRVASDRSVVMSQGPAGEPRAPTDELGHRRRYHRKAPSLSGARRPLMKLSGALSSTALGPSRDPAANHGGRGPGRREAHLERPRPSSWRRRWPWGRAGAVRETAMRTRRPRPRRTAPKTRGRETVARRSHAARPSRSSSLPSSTVTRAGRRRTPGPPCWPGDTLFALLDHREPGLVDLRRLADRGGPRHANRPDRGDHGSGRRHGRGVSSLDQGGGLGR